MIYLRKTDKNVKFFNAEHLKSQQFLRNNMIVYSTVSESLKKEKRPQN